MEIIDGQLHEPTVWQNWDGVSKEVWHKVLTEALLTVTDSVGARGAVIMPSTDAEWAIGVGQEYPDRFAIVPRLSPGNYDPELKAPDPGGAEMDPAAPNIRELITDGWNKKLFKGLRFSISFWEDVVELFYAGRFDNAFQTCSDLGIPAFMFVSGNVEIADVVAKKYPDLKIVIDHIGLKQIPLEVADTPTWRRLPEVLALAQYPNVIVKVCAPPAMSDEPYPHKDVYPFIDQMLEAFGPERLFWASDISRIRGRIGPHKFFYADDGDYAGKHSYAQSLGFFLYGPWSESEKTLMLGGTIRKFLNWPSQA